MKANYYDKLYFQLYSLLSKFGNYDLGFKAMMLFSAMIFAHVLTVVFLIYEKSEIEWLVSYLGVIIVGLPILIFNYFYFVHDHRYDKISEMIQKKSGRTRTPVLAGISYIVITVFLLLIVLRK